MTGPVDIDRNGVVLAEAARELQQAAHDVQVAFDCIGLEELDRAHTHAITARAAVDAAENALRVALGAEPRAGEPGVAVGAGPQVMSTEARH